MSADRPVVQLIVETVWHLDDLIWITVLNYDQVVRLKERPPLLQEVQVPACLFASFMSMTTVR